MIHQTSIERYTGSLKELAEDIGDLRYDSLVKLLKQLADKIKYDGDQDYNRNRIKLAEQLHQCAVHLNEAKRCIDKAWVICEPYTNK